MNAIFNESQNQLFYTDTALALQGTHSIMNRALVIMDELSPPQRGPRLACSTVRKVHSIRAAVREWRTAEGITSNVSGSVLFTQGYSDQPTEVRLELHGLQQLASGLHVHEVWVPIDRRFPCSIDAVHDAYNPLQIDSSGGIGIAPGVGSADQYEVGDLGGKFGGLTGKTSDHSSHLDRILSMYAPHSIVGRSVVIYQQRRNFRWTCGTIEPQLDKQQGILLQAMVSFHDPQHVIQGYVRLRQFEYKDGSTSVTWMNVNLKHAGNQNRNVTNDHGWAVYVNQVGADAFIAAPTVRCLASGFRWNPFLVESKSKSYERDCNQWNPLRCEMGDLTGRLGGLRIGGKKQLFADPNLPLVGNHSVMFRSLIIFDDKHRDRKLACGNILPERQLQASLSVRTHAGFTLESFMDHFRRKLQVAEWLAQLDLAASRPILDGQCVQATIRFFGADAHRLQIEFSNLLNLGSVVKQIQGVQKTIHTSYKPCRTCELRLYKKNLN